MKRPRMERPMDFTFQKFCNETSLGQNGPWENTGLGHNVLCKFATKCPHFQGLKKSLAQFLRTKHPWLTINTAFLFLSQIFSFVPTFRRCSLCGSGSSAARAGRLGSSGQIQTCEYFKTVLRRNIVLNAAPALALGQENDAAMAAPTASLRLNNKIWRCLVRFVQKT
jgi:hypothetical protein